MHRPGLCAAERLGVDTEFVRERTYRARPGLIQLSDGATVWLIDPIALGGCSDARSLLAKKFADPQTLKILHSVGEDLDVLHQVSGELPRPLFDTQLAAAMLGWPLQVRYEVLAADLLGVEFPGGQARSDWTRRPLPEAWLDYAANDVVALPEMQRILAERLRKAGRLGWLEEDCRRLVDGFNAPAEPLTRIKGAAALDDRALARLAVLAEWREARARDDDLPRGFVASDAMLLALARQPDRDPRQVARETGARRMPGRATRDAIAALLDAPAPAIRRPAALTPLSPGQRSRVRDLQQRVGRQAEALAIDPAVLASRRELTRLVTGSRCDWLDGWRGEVLAEVLC